MTATHSARRRVADVLGRPPVAGDVLVGRLTGAERHPEPAGEHLAERRRRLGDDRRVIALARCGDDPERQVGRRHRRAEPRPGEAGLALAFAPRREVVRRHRRVEPRLLRELHGTQQLARGDLLMGRVPADDGHPSPSPPSTPIKRCRTEPGSDSRHDALVRDDEPTVLLASHSQLVGLLDNSTAGGVPRREAHPSLLRGPVRGGTAARRVRATYCASIGCSSRT